MRKCRIANDGNNGFMLCMRKRELKTMGHRHGSAHIYTGVHRRQRRKRTKRVAADVAGDNCPHAGKLLEHQAVRTSRTQSRRASGHIGGHIVMLWRPEPHCSPNQPRRELAVARQGGRKLGEPHTKRRHRFSQILRRLFHNIDLADFTGKIL